MLYHDAIDNDIVKENPEMIAQILQQKEIEFYIGKYRPSGWFILSTDRLIL